MSPLLWRSSLRHLIHHPWQLALAVLGIALGVAVVLGVDLANESARKGFELSLEQVTGRTTHRIVAGRPGVPEAVYARLRVDLGLRQAAPVVTGYATLADWPGRRLQVLGVDVFAEAPFRAHLERAAEAEADLSALLTEPYTALLPPDLAQAGALDLLIGDRRVRLRGVGRLTDAALGGLVVTDISTAQALLGKQGRLDHIDLILPEGEAGGRLAAAIAQTLPPGLRLERAAERDRAVLDLSAAFQLNLTALSLLALVVGMFLIYNTMSFAVVQRRTLLGMLRAIGVTRREVFTLVLGEALLLGLAGTLLGGLLGVWLGSALVHLVTRTIDDLYYAVTVREFQLVPLSLLKAAALGLLATAAAAWLPAREAAAAPPGSALSRAHLESRWRQALPRLGVVSLVLFALGGAVLALSDGLIAGFGGLFLVILACTLLTPACLALLAHATQLALDRCARRASEAVRRRGRQSRGGLLARMAVRDVSRSLSRTGVAVAALMVAFAATVGVGVMVESFRGGVALWLTDLLNADLYVAPLSLEDGGSTIPLDPEVLAALHEAPGVAAVSTYRRSEVRVGHTLAHLIAVDLAPRARSGYRLKEGDPASAWRAFAENGAVLVSEPLAYRHRLQAGDTLLLDTDSGPHAFPIAGIFYDYGSEHGRILIDRGTYARLWRDPVVGSAALFVQPGEDPEAVRARLEASLGELQPLLVRGNRQILERSLAVFDRTFTITGVLRLLAIAVAFVGMLSALMALQLERARELAVLRATGMTRAEVGALVSLETGFMGLASGLLAIPVGLGLAAVLIFVIQRRSFGWTLPFDVDPWILLQAVLLALLAALLAGVYPLWRMARTQPAEALRSE